MPKKPQPRVFEMGGNEAAVSPDGSVAVTSTGGVEMVLEADGTPKIAGLTAFGVADLADIERIETIVQGDRTAFKITVRGGGTATVAYVAGKWAAYEGEGVALSILNKTTKAMIGSSKP